MFIELTKTEDINKLLTYHLLFAVVILILLLVIYLITYFVFEVRSDRKINYAINSCRIFVIDIDDDHYDYFQLNKIGNFNTHSFLNFGLDENDGNTLVYQSNRDFYKQFDFATGDKIREWLNDLVDTDKKNVSRTISCNIFFSKVKVHATVLMDAYCVIPEQKKIFVKSTVLKNTKVSSKIFGKMSSKNIKFDYTENEIVNLVGERGYKGYTLCYKFFFKEEGMENHKHSDSLIRGCYNILHGFFNKNRFICNDTRDDFSFVISDGQFKEKNEVLRLDAFIRKEFNQYLEVNGYESTYGIACSAVLNSLYRLNPGNLIPNARKLAEFQAVSKEESVRFDTDSGIDKDYLAESSYGTSDDVNYIRWKFDPIVHALANKNTCCSGYFADTLYESEQARSDFRRKCEHDKSLETLFEVPTKKMLSEFNSRIRTTPYFGKGKVNLFLKLNILDYQYFEGILKHYSYRAENGWDLHLTFNEEDLAKVTSDDLDLKEALSSLIKKYGLCLVLKNNNEFLLSNEIMNLFTFFAFDVKGEEISTNEQLKYNLTSKAGKTTRYSKNIIISGLKNWTDLELMLDYDISYVSGYPITPKPDNQVKVVEKRAIDKINGLLMKQ